MISYRCFCCILGGAVSILEEKAPAAVVPIGNAAGSPYGRQKMLSLGIGDVGWHGKVGRER